MESTHITEVLQKTVVPLILSYMPVVVTVLVAWITISQFYFRKPDKSQVHDQNEAPIVAKERKPIVAQSTVTIKTSKKKHQEKWSRDTKHNFSHEWLLTSLKGHTGSILDMEYSANGKYLATCADDRAIFIWNTKDWSGKEHKFIRYNVDFDHANHICWSPDSKAFIYNRSLDNVLEVCKLVKRPDGWVASVAKAITFPKVHKDETIGVGMAVTGRYIMTASGGTELVLWDVKGAELARLDSCLMNNFSAKVSPCGSFVTASGFAPDVKVWEVSFTKSGEFKAVSRAFELVGHNSGVIDVAFSADSSRVVTVSKDGTWRLYNIKIEYKKGEEPHLLLSGSYSSESGLRTCVAISPDGQVIALGVGSTLHVINATTGLIDKTIDNIYPGVIQKVNFDAGSDYILTAGEKHVRVFHNVTGHKVKLHNAKAKMSAPGNSSATKDRLSKTIAEEESFLANFTD